MNNWVVEQFLPAYPLLGINHEHLSDDVLGDRGNYVFILRDYQRFLYIVYEVDHVRGCVGRSRL
jgi:hypothetical protein